MDNDYRIVCEEVLRENRFDYEIIVAERAEPVTYSAEQLYFGPLQMQGSQPRVPDQMAAIVAPQTADP